MPTIIARVPRYPGTTCSPKMWPVERVQQRGPPGRVRTVSARLLNNRQRSRQLLLFVLSATPSAATAFLSSSSSSNPQNQNNTSSANSGPRDHILRPGTTARTVLKEITCPVLRAVPYTKNDVSYIYGHKCPYTFADTRSRIVSRRAYQQAYRLGGPSVRGASSGASSLSAEQKNVEDHGLTSAWPLPEAISSSPITSTARRNSQRCGTVPVGWKRRVSPISVLNKDEVLNNWINYSAEALQDNFDEKTENYPPGLWVPQDQNRDGFFIPPPSAIHTDLIEKYNSAPVLRDPKKFVELVLKKPPYINEMPGFVDDLTGGQHSTSGAGGQGGSTSSGSGLQRGSAGGGSGSAGGAGAGGVAIGGTSASSPSGLMSVGQVLSSVGGSSSGQGSLSSNNAGDGAGEGSDSSDSTASSSSSGEENQAANGSGHPSGTPQSTSPPAAPAVDLSEDEDFLGTTVIIPPGPGMPSFAPAVGGPILPGAPAGGAAGAANANDNPNAGNNGTNDGGNGFNFRGFFNRLFRNGGGNANNNNGQQQEVPAPGAAAAAGAAGANNGGQSSAMNNPTLPSATASSPGAGASGTSDGQSPKAPSPATRGVGLAVNAGVNGDDDATGMNGDPTDNENQEAAATPGAVLHPGELLNPLVDPSSTDENGDNANYKNFPGGISAKEYWELAERGQGFREGRPSWLCSISLDIMEDPVKPKGSRVLDCFEREYLLQSLASDPRHPLSREPVHTQEVEPCTELLEEKRGIESGEVVVDNTGKELYNKIKFERWELLMYHHFPETLWKCGGALVLWLLVTYLAWLGVKRTFSVKIKKDEELSQQVIEKSLADPNKLFPLPSFYINVKGSSSCEGSSTSWDEQGSLNAKMMNQRNVAPEQFATSRTRPAALVDINAEGPQLENHVEDDESETLAASKPLLDANNRKNAVAAPKENDDTCNTAINSSSPGPKDAASSSEEYQLALQNWLEKEQKELEDHEKDVVEQNNYLMPCDGARGIRILTSENGFSEEQLQPKFNILPIREKEPQPVVAHFESSSTSAISQLSILRPRLPNTKQADRGPHVFKPRNNYQPAAGAGVTPQGNNGSSFFENPTPFAGLTNPGATSSSSGGVEANSALDIRNADPNSTIPNRVFYWKQHRELCTFGNRLVLRVLVWLLLIALHCFIVWKIFKVSQRVVQFQHELKEPFAWRKITLRDQFPWGYDVWKGYSSL
ncbi:unnamed protein product [Amoebophrya sp. A120]|nr:unnamed protein product [Amoebophrya sp. A120]|eukprot:GSA120T00024812001.1